MAFDGTVTAVRLEEEVPKAGDRRASADFDVHEVLRGNVGATQRMRTWTFFLPKDPQMIVGQRVLVSTGASTDEIESCGYSRPWSESDLVEWRRLFASREEAP
ncbi:MAG: hypothetical protein M3P34_02955 [Actinomycetota bacterium]|nr:hypothetical protein [Actinomycetota bacterium]